MKHKKVVICIPTYNNLKHLKMALRSILESTSYPNYQIYLNDSESTDGTAEYIDGLQKKDPKKFKAFHTPKNGPAPALNFMMREAGDADVYLTQTDVVHVKLFARDWLGDFVEWSKKKEVGILTCLGGGGVSGDTFIKDFRWVGTWCCYIPRRIIDLVGYIDENMKCGDDIDYTYRVNKVGFAIGVLNYWVDHHQQLDCPHAIDPEKYTQAIIDSGKYFRKKHKLEVKKK